MVPSTTEFMFPSLNLQLQHKISLRQRQGPQPYNFMEWTALTLGRASRIKYGFMPTQDVHTLQTLSAT